MLLVGWLPLLAVILFSESDANPIGLGLLAWMATLIDMPLGAFDIFRGFQRWRAQ